MRNRLKLNPESRRGDGQSVTGEIKGSLNCFCVEAPTQQYSRETNAFCSNVLHTLEDTKVQLLEYEYICICKRGQEMQIIFLQ